MADSKAPKKNNRAESRRERYERERAEASFSASKALEAALRPPRLRELIDPKARNRYLAQRAVAAGNLGVGVADVVTINNANQGSMGAYVRQDHLQRGHLSKHGLDEKSHQEFYGSLTPEQRLKLPKMDQEEQKQLIDDWRMKNSSTAGKVEDHDDHLTQNSDKTIPGSQNELEDEAQASEDRIDQRMQEAGEEMPEISGDSKEDVDADFGDLEKDSPSVDDDGRTAETNGESAASSSKELGQDSESSGEGKSVAADESSEGEGSDAAGEKDGVVVSDSGSGGDGASGGAANGQSDSDSSDTDSDHTSEDEVSDAGAGDDGLAADTAGEADLGPESFPPSDLKGTEITTAGEPINLFNGEEFLQIDDFIIPGAIPLVWKRTYRSSNDRAADLGCGWTRSYSDRLQLLDNEILHFDSENRVIPFPRLGIGESAVQAYEQTRLERIEDGLYVLSKLGEPDLVFRYVKEDICILIRLRDSRDNQVRFHYDGELSLQMITCHSLGYKNRKFRVLSTESGLIRTVIPMAGAKQLEALVTYKYDEERDLIEARDAAGYAELYEYRNHVITKRTLKTGYSFYFEWDQYNKNARCQRNWGDDRNYNYLFHWNDEDNRTGVTNSLGVTCWYRFNARGQVEEYVDGKGFVHRYVYDEQGNLILAIDPEGHRAEFRYDESRRLIYAENVLGHQYRYSYDGSGRLERFVGPNGYEWRWIYDDLGQLIQSSDPLGNSTKYTYDDSLLTSIESADGSLEQFVWDKNGKLEKNSFVSENYEFQNQFFYDQDGRITKEKTITGEVRYEYDVYDRIVSVISGGRKTSYEYNALGKVLSVTYPDGTADSVSYNESGFVTRFIDKLGRKTEWSYEGLSQVIYRRNPDGSDFHYEYDGERNLIGLVNENGDRYNIIYDANERVIREEGFDGRVQSYGYSSQGYLISKKDGIDIEIDYRRDALGQLLELRASDGTFQKYSYDINGRVASAENNYVKESFRYDPLGRMVSEAQGELITTHLYNAGGQRIQTMTPSGRSIVYEYDGLGLWSSVSFCGDEVASVERDSYGVEVERTQGNVRTLTARDVQGRLYSKTGFKHEKPILQLEYTYDLVGRIKTIRDLKQGEKAFFYDPCDRLREIQGITSETFKFDPAGNILRDPIECGESEKKQGNQLDSFGNLEFLYDERGNLVLQKERYSGLAVAEYRYNALNQLIYVNREGSDYQFEYDCFGRRISKKSSEGETRFVWDGDILLSELEDNKTKTYLFEPGGYIPLAQIADEEVYHYYNDHLGTPQQLFDNDGDIVWQALYSAYGAVEQQQVELIQNPFRYLGQYCDEELGLNYNRHRYYDPQIGRFIQQDPIGLNGGYNCYEYAPNTLQWVDPLGLCKESTELDNRSTGLERLGQILLNDIKAMTLGIISKL